jgi:hypothetical protein
MEADEPHMDIQLLEMIGLVEEPGQNLVLVPDIDEICGAQVLQITAEEPLKQRTLGFAPVPVNVGDRLESQFTTLLLDADDHP